MHRWLEWRTTKLFCLTLATLFALEQAVWGADPSALASIQRSGEVSAVATIANTATGAKSMTT